MYEDFLSFILDAIRMLNKFENEHPDTPTTGITYLGRIPVFFEEELQGYLADEIGGVWSFQPLTLAERSAKLHSV